MTPLFINKDLCENCEFLRTVKWDSKEYDAYLCASENHANKEGNDSPPYERLIMYIDSRTYFDSNTYSRFDRLRSGDYSRFPLLMKTTKLLCNEFEISTRPI